jgi:hypothetical protein
MSHKFTQILLGEKFLVILYNLKMITRYTVNINIKEITIIIDGLDFLTQLEILKVK